MVRFYRKGRPHRKSHWFKGPEGREQALNYDDNNSRYIYKLVVIPDEENSYFKQNGIGYQIAKDGFSYLKKRIEKRTIEEFQDLCNDPDPLISRFI